MQHIVHIFIGSELVSFRNQFASMYRKRHSDHEDSLFTAISITEDEEGRYILSPDEAGNSLDGVTVAKDNRQTLLYNFFDDMYRRKVTVAHPGNRSLVVILWAKLYLDDNFDIINELTAAISRSNSNFHIEVSGFTNDAVSCFITNPSDREAPDIYRNAFDRNIDRLMPMRDSFSALRLIANRNMNNVALDLNEESMARICAEHSALMCEHYLNIHPTVINIRESPFESFGISSIMFDSDYYQTYIKNRIILDTMQNQGVENRRFNINALAKTTNPIIRETLEEIAEFKDKQAANAKAELSLDGAASTSNIVAKIDKDVKDIIKNLENKVGALLSSGKISIFESEALLALILGEDCPMFDSSAIDADEQTIDDIINKAAEYYVRLDEDKLVLKPISQDAIKSVRKQMRNIAVANRQREDRLKDLNVQINDSQTDDRHLNINGYKFGGTEYKVDLNIDSEPLELTYEPHDVTVESVDLTNNFAPVRNQGRQGSCASFAVSSVIEAMRKDKRRYSPAFLYWSAREITGNTDRDSGATLLDVIKGATLKGICSEDNMPYNADNFSMAPTESAIKEASDCLVIEAKTVNTNLRDIRSALSDGFPVIIATKIFDSFSDTMSGFVRHPSKKEMADGTRNDGHGNHAMVVCGFSDKERVLIVRNSWGKDFGVNGYCYIPYSYAQKYFLQACVITQISSSETADLIEHKKTINFNLSDSNIEAAILQNLIDEDNDKLQELAEESVKLRSDWAHNVATLGNVNNQAAIINNVQSKIDERITDENSDISRLQSSENQKIKDYKKKYIKRMIYTGIYFVADAIFTIFFPSLISLMIFGLSALVFFGLIGAYSYRWRRFRQNLRDEIQNHADRINRLQQKKFSHDINAHIYGTILRETERYRLNLIGKYQLLKKFNRAWLNVYERVKREHKNMTPVASYPFMTVLENDLLDRYYAKWRDKMVGAIDLDSIYSEFSNGAELEDILRSNQPLKKTIMRGLRNFSMKEYIARQDPLKWQFLPDTAKMAEVIPDLDTRAIPFCPYNNQTDNTLEKYIFVKDISQDEMNGITRYFTQSPMPVRNSDAYTISILNTVRYNLTPS